MNPFDEKWFPALSGLFTGLLVGNVLGALEILYIVYRLSILNVDGYLDLVSHMAAGALLYGFLMMLIFSIVIGFLGLVLKRDLKPSALYRSLCLTLSAITAVFLFPTLSRTIWLDIPGIDELYRYLDLMGGCLIVGSLLYYLLTRWKGIQTRFERFVKRTHLKKAVYVLIVINLLMVPTGWPVFRIEVPGTDHTTEPSAQLKTPVIFIGIDTLRADHLEPYNFRLDFKTPAASRLAEDGVVYLNNTAQWPKTTPSFASIFTSLYPAEIPIYGNSQPIPENQTTWAEFLKEQGYRNQAIVSSFAVHKRYLGQGFDGYVNRQGWGIKNMKILRYVLQHVGGDMPTSLTKRWIQNKPQPPFFLFLHYIIPHAPYHPPFPFSQKLDPWYTGRASGSQDALDAIRAGSAYQNSRDIKHVEALYDGEVAYTDREINEVIDTLKNHDLYDRSLIIYGSDHGETMKQHKRTAWFKHSMLYQSDIDVPLIIKYPNNRHAGRRIKAPTSNLDLLPTVLSELGLDIPDYMRGSPLQPDEFTPRSRIFSQKKHGSSLRLDEWKLIHRFNTAESELYNLREDPHELSDVSDKHPEKVSSMLETIEAFREHTYKPESFQGYTEEEKKRLKGLGYLK